ncbi:poly-gamma-glutamate hydrolase family protein [Bacillus haynesii]|uniref:poly-gamma-glutamate hydrolase family protein n=2 Tax=Bacillus haynesii TaxID=1925021 RepID=UPI00227FF91F|nr:poly-gamma-glutamate hydrolase family protein [Bacillus haynesii]MCY8668785.1 poly-gamma-glutamate hydrolase family protein [Bacillus haynesii]
MMADLFNSFEELRQSMGYGTDYHILMGVRPSNVLFTAIHGGGIELGCTELALLSAGSTHSYYCFEGWRSSGNGDLHITSTHFDEPNGKKLVADSEITVSYHGYSDSNNKHTKVGGLERELRKSVYDKLIEAGFSAEILPDSDSISGTEKFNITNTNRRVKGVQLELSTAQRNAFFDVNTRAERRNTTNAEFDNYVNAILSAINEFEK